MIKSASQSSLLNDKKYTSMLAGYTAASDYKLDEVILTGITASVTFDVSSYAGIYKNLQLRMVTHTASGANPLVIRFNSDSTYTNYASHFLSGNGSAMTSNYRQNSGYLGISTEWSVPGSESTANEFGGNITDILDCFSSVKYKVTKSLSGASGPTVKEINLQSGVWLSTSPITSITLVMYGAANFSIGSRFSLYGSI